MSQCKFFWGQETYFEIAVVWDEFRLQNIESLQYINARKPYADLADQTPTCFWLFSDLRISLELHDRPILLL